jgi:molybdenum cofactor cytidylyltransferase
VRQVAVVLGAGDERGRALLDSIGVRAVEPESPDEGRAASVRAGLAALPPDAEGVLFALADQPFLEPEDFDALIERFERGDVGMVHATYDGERGSPVLFGVAYRAELEELRGSEGGRAVILRHPHDAVGVPLPPERGRDLDSPEDLPVPR